MRVNIQEINKYKSIDFFTKQKQPIPSIVFDTYWKFAAERQEIFYKRLQNGISPWTSDSILNHHKFTNVYRATDRVSQYLIKEVIYKGNQKPSEVLFRIILFKLFNKIETWELISKYIGEISYETYDFYNYNKILENAKRRGTSIYSGAYIMASGRETFGYDLKHQNHLKLVEQMLENKFHENIVSFVKMKDLYDSLKEYATIGPFLAYQFSIDINYSNLTNFSEMDFVKAGPGAIDGIRKCFIDLGDFSEEDVIKMMADIQHKEFERLGINFKDLFGRPMQLIDCQNIFCEVDKYSRIAHPEIKGLSKRKRIKQKFKPSSAIPIDYFFPPKWEINSNIK